MSQHHRPVRLLGDRNVACIHRYAAESFRWIADLCPGQHTTTSEQVGDSGKHRIRRQWPRTAWRFGYRWLENGSPVALLQPHADDRFQRWTDIGCPIDNFLRSRSPGCPCQRSELTARHEKQNEERATQRLEARRREQQSGQNHARDLKPAAVATCPSPAGGSAGRMEPKENSRDTDVSEFVSECKPGESLKKSNMGKRAGLARPRQTLGNREG